MATTKSNTNQQIQEFQKQIGIFFKNTSLLSQALTHRSYLNEHQDFTLGHNERLEFLGDAVLELVISDYLYRHYPNRPEGDLTSFRSAVVKTTTLANASRKLNIGQYLQMSKGEEETGGRDKDYLLANTFEAVVGAIYLDQGLETARKYILEQLVPVLEDIIKFRLDIDAKTKFQEIAQQRFKVTPKYILIDEDGPDHDKKFIMSAQINGKSFGVGVGKTKQKAEENAATEALKKLS